MAGVATGAFHISGNIREPRIICSIGQTNQKVGDVVERVYVRIGCKKVCGKRKVVAIGDAVRNNGVAGSRAHPCRARVFW